MTSGGVRMATLPLDVPAVMRELPQEATPLMPEATVHRATST